MAAVSPKTLFEILDETIDALDGYRRDPAVTKADVLDSMETQLSIAPRKMLATPMSTSYCIFRPPRAQALEEAEAHPDKLLYPGISLSNCRQPRAQTLEADTE